MKPQQYYIWNIFMAIVLWKGVQGDHAAQYLYVSLQWFFVSFLCIAHLMINHPTIIGKLKVGLKDAKLGANKLKTFIVYAVDIAFFFTLLWYDWLWTAFAILLHFALVTSLKTEIKKLKK
jgi:hypothetical protein